MGRWPKLIGLIVLLCFTLSCRSLELRKARAGVDESVAQLPVLDGFDVIEIVHLDHSMNEGGGTCYYATAYVIFGSYLPEMEALDVYSAALQSTGYFPRQIQYATSRVFYRGPNERVVIRVGEPGVDFEDAVDWARLKATYPTTMFVSIKYILPQRDGC